MDFSQIGLFNLMKAKLNYASERQSILAQNIANADTPDYKAMDIKEPDFAKLVAGANGASPQLKMVTTDGKHLTGSGNANEMFTPEKRKTTYELNPNGNNVSIEEEMSKIATNQADYQKVVNLYGKMVGMFKMAIGNPNGGG